MVLNDTVRKMDPSCVYIESVSTVFESMIAMKGRTGFSKSSGSGDSSGCY